MTKYKIQDKEVEIDNSKIYMDYHKDKGLSIINFDGLLSSISSGEITIDKFDEFLYPMTRWITESPRKRFYRNIQLEHNNFHVLSGENFFLEDGGDKIIDNLENTGKMSVYLRKELFGLENTMIVKV
jgi:hypothetical protein